MMKNHSYIFDCDEVNVTTGTVLSLFTGLSAGLYLSVLFVLQLLLLMVWNELKFIDEETRFLISILLFSTPQMVSSLSPFCHA